MAFVLRFLSLFSASLEGDREAALQECTVIGGIVVSRWIGVSLTASLISSLCSSVSLLSGFASCAGPWDCAFVAGAGADCCICFWPSGPLKSP